MPACHAGGRGFNPVRSANLLSADMAQLVERTLGKGEVPSSTLGISTISSKSPEQMLWFFCFYTMKK